MRYEGIILNGTVFDIEVFERLRKWHVIVTDGTGKRVYQNVGFNYPSREIAFTDGFHAAWLHAHQGW